MSKKSSKKPVKATVVVPAFDKKNAQAFADLIFSNKGGMISCVKLCDGDLQNGKDGKRTMHCAVGEAYYTFVNPSLKSVLQKDRNANEYQSKHSVTVVGSTAAAIDALVEVAKLKNDTEQNRAKLAQALDNCVSSNDNGDITDPDDELLTYIERSRNVAKTWTAEVVPLLK